MLRIKGEETGIERKSGCRGRRDRKEGGRKGRRKSEHVWSYKGIKVSRCRRRRKGKGRRKGKTRGKVLYRNTCESIKKEETDKDRYV